LAGRALRLRHAGIHLAPQDEAEEPGWRHVAALTEDNPKNMTPEQQKAVEQKIEPIIQQPLQKNAGKTGQVVNFSALPPTSSLRTA
jgi:hypothetical protein